MPVKCYLARPHEHQSEEIAARTLFQELRLCLDPDEPASLVCNLTVYGSQTDAVLFTPHAVTVIDWKASLGPITGTDTDPWLRAGVPVLAGSHINPYRQILDKRLTLAGFFRKNAARYLDEGGARFDQRAFSQVSAALVFIPTTPEHSLNLPKTAATWLTLTGLDAAAKAISAHRSHLRLRPAEAAAIIEQAWNCPRWEGLEALLPNRAAGVLRYFQGDGHVHSREVVRSLTIGRGSESDWVLHPTAGNDLARVSRRHAQVHTAGGEAVLYDLDSANGTYVNGQKLPAGEPCALRYGDVIVLGAPAANAARLEYAGGMEPGDDRTTYKTVAA